MSSKNINMMIVNDMLNEMVYQLLNHEYSSLESDEALIRWNNTGLEKLDMDEYNSTRQYQIFMSLVLIRLIDYMNKPKDESTLHKLCEVLFHPDSTHAMPIDELFELRTLVCKHLLHLLNQSFFTTYKQAITRYVEFNKSYTGKDFPISEISAYSRHHLIKDVEDHVRENTLEYTTCCLIYLNQRRHLFGDLKGDEDRLIDAFGLQQHELAKKRMSQLPTSHHASPVSDESAINISKKPRIESQANVKTSLKATKTNRTHSETDDDQEAENKKMASRSSRKKAKVRFELDEETSDRPAVNVTIQEDITELDFGEEPEKVSKKKKKQNMNQLKSIENVSTSPKKDGTLSFKRKPAPSSSSASNDDDQENQRVAVDDNAQNNKMVVRATRSRGHVESDTDEDMFESRKATVPKRVKWGHAETSYLVYGVDKYGKGNWSRILEVFKTKFQPYRDNVALKDRWRVLEKNEIEMKLYKKRVAEYVDQHGSDDEPSF